MTQPVEQRRYTIAEYLERERASPEKHEYDAGEILAMAGASPAHVRIVGNTFAGLHRRLQGRPCEPFVGDLRVRIPPRQRYVYPDVSVVCGAFAFDPDDAARQTVTNPTLVVEVSSPSTELYDRKAKFEAYRDIPTFREYVLVSQDTPLVEAFFRQDDGVWIFDAASGVDGVLRLRSLGVELSLREVYARVEFPDEAPPPVADHRPRE